MEQMADLTAISATQKRQVRAALRAILGSEQFSSSSQMSGFLSFIVEKTLDGQADEIKAYTIAVDALGRSEDFDPQTNAAVRVAAGRLRQALSLYNANADATDKGARIALEPGSYIPVFTFLDGAEVLEQELRAAVVPSGPEEAHEINSTDSGPQTTSSGPAAGSPPAAKASTEPVGPRATEIEQDFKQDLSLGRVLAGIAVGLLLLALLFVLRDEGEGLRSLLGPSTKSEPADAARPAPDIRPSIRADILLPETGYPDWYVPSETAQAVRVTVSRFDDLHFLGAQIIESYPLTAEQTVDYQMIITAYPRGSLVRFYGNLIRTSDNKIIWSTQRLFGPPVAAENRSVPQIVGSIFASIGSPYGVIYADVAQRSSDNCLTKVYAYFYSESDERHRDARACAQKLIDEGSRQPIVHATLTFLLLDEYREKRNPQSSDPLGAAMARAQRAVELSPQSARAHQAHFAVLKVRRLTDQARQAGARAVQLNPFDTDILGDYGAWLISIGDLEEGAALLKRADAMLGVRPAWMEFYLFLSAQLSGEVDEAARIARTLDVNRSPLLALAAAIGASLRGDLPRRQTAIAALNAQAPDFLIDPEAQFRRRGFNDEVTKTIVDTMRLSKLLKQPSQ